MNVLYVCGKSYYFTEGYRGRVIHAKGIVEGLLQNGCKVEVVSGPGISKYLEMHENLKITSIGDKSNTFFGEILWRKKLLRYLANNSMNDLAIIRYGFSNPFLSLRFSKIHKKSNTYSVVEVNSLGTDSIKIFEPIRSLISLFELYIISHYDKVYVVSEEEKKRIEKVKRGINIIVIPNATGNTDIASTATTNVVRFVYLGVLHDYYNFDEIVNAFEKIKGKLEINLSLVIYGYGKNETILKERAKKDSDIKLMGKYDNNKVHELVNRDSDILLLPYKKGTLAEIGSPMKLFEYMVLGAPILASNVGQLNDIFDTGRNGYLYKAGNVNSLFEKMNYLIKNKKERKEVGIQAHKEAVQNHNWKNRMHKLINSISN